MRKGQATLAVLAVGVAVAAVVVGMSGTPAENTQEGLETFDSEEDFRGYLESAPSTDRTYLGTGTARPQLESMDTAASAGGDAGGVERAAKTNVQEEGLQEPDVLKFSEGHFYYAPERGHYIPRITGDAPGVMPRYRASEPNTSVISSLATGNVSEVGKIPVNGRMLRDNGTLAVFERGNLRGYDISDPSEPSLEWNISLNGSVEAARRTGGDIYLVLEKDIDRDSPCPVVPMKEGGETVTVPCNDIWHPRFPSSSSATFTAARVSMDSGEVGDTTTFVGSRRNTVVYMSRNDIYMTYSNSTDETGVLLEFLTGPGSDMIDGEAKNALEELQGYDLSRSAKEQEMQNIVRGYLDRLPDDERSDWNDRFRGRIGNWSLENRRDFASTGIVRIDTGEMEVEANGRVPGRVNDQFSMDASSDNFRIATTVSTPVSSKTANDLYVLDDSLERVGEVQGMGLNERIYSVRFLDETAYVVTFRRIDPFHVVDLSEPSDPEVTGELKLPGFSSYLHPLEEDRILGIGEENRSVKAVIFDVSDPANPEVEQSRILDSYHSEAGSNHHAFMQDPKHEVFFLPTNEGGHVFSYADGIEHVKTVNVSDPKRARYVNDQLYVFGEREVAVLDETSWEETARLEFRPEPQER
ncbi:MAG: beta-propeller domain-containing protein [Candidatus Nanohaloarchaeota archaeon QJJ-7]|nr:beta-propeller domain-containing protein [Candidatus Nanohaloarchaeota archaeon QJJ-7]